MRILAPALGWARMLDSEITKKMTPDEYITLAGKYCERMEWNHDAIPELAECLERHDKNITRFLEGEKIARQYAIDKGVELQRENTRLKRCEEAFKLMREYLIEQIIPEAEDDPMRWRRMDGHFVRLCREFEFWTDLEAA